MVILIWNGKGDSHHCNYHGTSLLSKLGKILVHLLMMRISHLLKRSEPDQFGFTLGKSTTDRILALRLLERMFRHAYLMLAAHVDLKKAFDLVDREVLWDILCLRKILRRNIGLLLWGCECCKVWRGADPTS